MPRTWTFSIDRGGTFTDIVAHAGRAAADHESALRQSAPYADAAVDGIRRIVDADGGSIGAVRMGTTVATNALLERKGDERRWSRPAASAMRCASATRRGPTSSRARSCCRRRSTGRDRGRRAGDRGGRGADAARRGGARAPGCRRPLTRAIARVAIVLMHGWRWTAHEAALADIARELGFTQVSASHEVEPADQTDRARRHRRGRRLSVAGAAPLCRPGRGGARAGARRCSSCSRTAGSTDAAALPRQGRDPLGPGRRHRRHGADRRARPASTS